MSLPYLETPKMQQLIQSGNTKDPKSFSLSLERRTELEASHSLISNYTIKLELSKQYGAGIKTDI